MVGDGFILFNIFWFMCLVVDLGKGIRIMTIVMFCSNDYQLWLCVVLIRIILLIIKCFAYLLIMFFKIIFCNNIMKE